MSEILVGCCGPAGMKLKLYSSKFRLLEVQSTFYRLPMKSTVERWKSLASGLTFTLKAFQGVTHPPDSPTWRIVMRELEGTDPADVGLLKPSVFVRKAWERTAETADTLGAKVVVVQLPQSYKYNQKNLHRLRQFFSEFAFSFVPAVELRHKSWLARLDAAASTLSGCGGIVITDPLKVRPPVQPVQYHRLHGRNGFVNYSYRYAQDDLNELATKVKGTRAYGLFNNIFMREDAEEFIRVLSSKDNQVPA
jgi:uncharacterized protein YecE (DUF72 family)